MTGISNVRLERQKKEDPLNTEETVTKNAFSDLSASVKGSLALAIYRTRLKKDPPGKFTPREIDNILGSATSEDVASVVLEKQFGITKAYFDSILSTSGLSADNKRLFYDSGGSSLSELQRVKIRSELAANGFTPSEINKILNTKLGSADAVTGSLNIPLTSLNNVFGSSPIIIKPFPSKPNMTLESFSDVMFEAMHAVIISRAKTQLYDTESAQQRFQDMVLTMEDKIKVTKDQAEIISEQGRVSYDRLKNAKMLQALLAGIAALVAVIMAIITVAVSIATFGAGTAPMVAATVGAIIGVTGALTGAGLAISDALRTDGRSWADDLIGKPKTVSSAEEQEAFRIKREQAQLGAAIAEGVIDAIASIFSFGAYIAAAVSKTIISQTIKALIRAIMEAMRSMMMRTISTIMTMILGLVAKIMGALVQSGTMVRNLAGPDAENSSENAISASMELRKQELKDMTYFTELAKTHSNSYVESKINEYIEKEKKLVVSGDLNGLVNLKKELSELANNPISSTQISKFTSESESQIKQAIVDEQTYYLSLSSRVFSENQSLIMGLMIGSAVAAMLAAFATSVISYKSSSVSSTTSVSALDKIDDLLEEVFDDIDEVDDVGESMKDLISMKESSAKWRERSNSALFAASTMQSILGASASIYQSISQHANLEEQKSVTMAMAKVNRLMAMLEAHLFMMKMLSESSLEVQHITIESMKKTAEAFADFWKSAETTFSVAVQQQY